MYRMRTWRNVSQHSSRTCLSIFSSKILASLNISEYLSLFMEQKALHLISLIHFYSHILYFYAISYILPRFTYFMWILFVFFFSFADFSLISRIPCFSCTPDITVFTWLFGCFLPCYTWHGKPFKKCVIFSITHYKIDDVYKLFVC